MKYIPIIIMLVLGCNTLHALDYSLFLRLSAGEEEHAVVEVDGIDAGAAGDGCVWDFGGPEALCVHKVQTAGEDSVLAVTFMRNVYRYCLDGPVLRWQGFENRLTKLADSVGAPVMRFPFEYGDSIVGPINMEGRYSTDTQCMESGTLLHVADARGTVILPDDTIRNVLRVKTVRSTRTLIADSVDRAIMDAMADSLPVYVQTDYRWYSDRFALPLARRSDMTLVYGDSAVALGSLSLILEAAYLSVPSEESREDNGDDDAPGNYTQRRTQQSGGAVIGRHADGTIEVQYRLGAGAAMLETTVCDLGGRVYYHSSAENVEAGYRSETMALPGAAPGQYMLVVKTEEDILIKQLFEL